MIQCGHINIYLKVSSKGRILPFIWIAAFASMTIKCLISIGYNIHHTREGGYPGRKVTFYDIIIPEL